MRVLAHVLAFAAGILAGVLVTVAALGWWL